MPDTYVPTTSFESIDITLPMLPGAIGPGSSTAVIRVQVSEMPSSETVTFDRLEFFAILDDETDAGGGEVEPEVAIEEMRTMIVDRPEAPYADWTKARLYKRAKELKMPGRSKLTKAKLRAALIAFEGR